MVRRALRRGVADCRLSNLGRRTEAQGALRSYFAKLQELWHGDHPPSLDQVTRWFLQLFPFSTEAAWSRLRPTCPGPALMSRRRATNPTARLRGSATDSCRQSNPQPLRYGSSVGPAVCAGRAAPEETRRRTRARDRLRGPAQANVAILPTRCWPSQGSPLSARSALSGGCVSPGFPGLPAGWRYP